MRPETDSAGSPGPDFGSSILSAVVFLLSCIVGQLAAYRWVMSIGDGGPTSQSESVSLAFGYGHSVEWLAVILLAVWMVGRRRPIMDHLFCLLFFLFLVGQATQFLAFYFTRQFLTPDALHNAVHIGLLVSPFSLCVAALPILLTLAVVVLLFRTRGARSRVRTRVLLTCGVVVAGFVLVMPFVGSAPAHRWAHQSPPGGFPVSRLFDLLLGGERLPGPTLAADDVQIARDFGFVVDPGSPYPFIKQRIHDGTTPFRRLRQSEAQNLIVFFVESLSARKLSIYDSPHAGITPEIEEFARQAMVVDNYFSHTAATYRGLRGQLCSIYPFYGGVGGWFEPDFEPPKVRLLGLPTMLQRDGYDTVLLGANTAQKARMDVQAEAVGFARSLLRDQILADLLGPDEAAGTHLSDHQMMRALWSTIETGRVEQPFFAFVYNVGTHTNLDARSDGVIYGDGSNKVLNTTRTFDDAFGKFWRRFIASGLAANTVVILTADHPHFPTPAFIEVAGPDYQKVFFDRIPLVIYHPDLDLPRRFDPGVTTSLDFAPSIAHLMELPNRRNHFLGHSIFEHRKDTRRQGGVGQYGETLCVIRPNGRITVHSMAADRRPKIAGLARFIKFSQHIELSDRLWDGREDD